MTENEMISLEMRAKHHMQPLVVRRHAIQPKAGAVFIVSRHADVGPRGTATVTADGIEMVGRYSKAEFIAACAVEAGRD